MTDTEIIQFFNMQNKNSEVCGRFKSTQLSRPLRDTSIAPFRKNSLKWAASLLLVLSAKMSFAGLPAKNNAPKTEQSEKTFSDFPENPPQTHQKKTEKNVISGEVMDHSGRRLPNVAIRCSKDKTYSDFRTDVKTDSNGYFKFKVPDSLLTDEIYLVVSYNGFETEYLTIKKEDIAKPLEIQLARPYRLIGKIASPQR